MNLSNLINYSMNKSINNTDKYNIEFEIRFGKYNNISSNIKQNTFFKIYKLDGTNAINKLKSHTKIYTLTSETFFNTTDKEPIRQRIIYTDSKNLIKSMFDKNIILKNSNQKNTTYMNSNQKNTTSMNSNQKNTTYMNSNQKNTNEISKNCIMDIVNTYSSQKVNDGDKLYVSKSKIMKGDINNLFKAEIVGEHIHNSTPNTDEIMKKYKLRCSWLEDMWMYDLTILLIDDLKSGKSGIFYEVEIEYNHNAVIKNKYTHENVLDSAVKIINSITTVIDCAKISDIDVEIKYSLYNAVETMERTRIPLLQTALYSVVDKADGERKFIYIDMDGNIFYFNPTEGYITKIPLVKNTKITLGGTLIDCELIKVSKDDSRFYGFDLIFFKNEDCRNYNLNERLILLNKTITELNKCDKTSGYKYAIKKFYTDDVFKNAANIWENREKLFPYNLDGLIFTPIRGSYLGNLPNLKYKPLVSIDVRIMYHKDNNFTEFYANGYPIEIKGKIINAYKDHKTQKTYYKSRVNLNDNQLKNMGAVNNKGVLGVVGRVENMPDMVDIVEMEFEPSEKHWKFLRTRPDKETANAFKTIVSALNAIKDNITIEEISKLKHIKSPYELCSGAECFTKMGFNFTSATIASPLCSFYKYAYTNIIGLAGSPSYKTILVLGCDLCLLNSLIESKYEEIVIIESNCLEVYGETKSEGYQGLLETINKFNENNENKSNENNKIKSNRIKIIWGDTNISNGLIAFNKKGQSDLNNYKKIIFDTVFIKSFEKSLCKDGDYTKDNKFDLTNYNKYMNNLNKLTKNVIGLFMSGDKILEHLENQDCLIMRNKDLHPLWKLYLDSDSIPDLIKLKESYVTLSIFKNNDIVKTFNIQRMQNSFLSETYPVIFDNNIVDILKEFKSKSINSFKCGSLKSFYTDYKKSNNNITDYDYILADINKYFILSF